MPLPTSPFSLPPIANGQQSNARAPQPDGRITSITEAHPVLLHLATALARQAAGDVFREAVQQGMRTTADHRSNHQSEIHGEDSAHINA